MAKMQAVPTISADSLRQMDQEFLAGKYDALTPPDLRPVEDPFGRDFDWASPVSPATPFDQAYEEVGRLAGDDRAARTAKTLRRVSLGGTLAGSTDHDLVVNWAQDSFPAKCLAAGAAGTDLLLALAAPDFGLQYLTKRVAEFLASDPDFQSLSLPDQVLVAHAIALHHPA